MLLSHNHIFEKKKFSSGQRRIIWRFIYIVDVDAGVISPKWPLATEYIEKRGCKMVSPRLSRRAKWQRGTKRRANRFSLSSLMMVYMIHSDARDYGTAQVRRDLCITAPHRRSRSAGPCSAAYRRLSSLSMFLFFFFIILLLLLLYSFVIILLCGKLWQLYGQMSVYPRRCQGLAAYRYTYSLDAISARARCSNDDFPYIFFILLLFFTIRFVIAGCVCVCSSVISTTIQAWWIYIYYE